MLLAGICAMVWWYASQKAEEPSSELPANDARPLGRNTFATRDPQYFWVVSALIVVQLLIGVITAASKATASMESKYPTCFRTV